SKTNQTEAERVVDLVFENIKKYPERSLGVVAFSISQQNLIEKLIYRRRQQNSAFEEFFKSDRVEPFFVKNLETVQGDERDTIIFSIAYAKDSQGRLLLNFGPINREGGERRLNVAVTRAKINVQLVSSMHYCDIDLSRTKSVGARLLREYLDYAENGVAALERSITVDASNPFEQYDSEFESEVCEFLRENGFAVDPQVGCSSFKIDLALKRPDSSDYVLAIECDGATYHSSKTARDRDRLRQEILERMGWKFYRIWSTDWFRNKHVEKNRLLDAAKKALENCPANVNPPDISNDNFSEVVIEKQFEFPKYKMVDAMAVARKNGRNILAVTRAIVEVESPVSEEWLLKRIVFLFAGREKVTNVVRKEFNRYMWNCARYGIVRKDGFLYMQGRQIPMLRVPSAGDEPRDIKYIELRELALGLKEILKQNVSAEKQGLYRLLTQNLGFSRIGDAILERMDSALELIYKDIEINGEMISLK
ncbi:MAG: type III restriction endonuclease subunit R, partial [Clostridiales bacterium]|nr:type III restriction endonuclease subunit R [Clostridiales bacterium]